MKTRRGLSLLVEEIHAHPDNPRKNLGDLSELTKSIQAFGVMQNVTVMEGHYEGSAWVDDGYTVLLGHRRLAAARAAGLERVPANVVEGLDRRGQITLMLEENMQRNDLTICEQAQSFQLMLDLGETVESIAKKTGFSETTVRHRCELAALDPDLLRKRSETEYEEDGYTYYQLNLTDLYKLEKIEDKAKRNEILKRARGQIDIKVGVENYLRERRWEMAKKILRETFLHRKMKEISQSETWNDKWDRCARIKFDDVNPLKNVEEFPDAGAFYIGYSGAEVYRKAEKQKAERSKPSQLEMDKKYLYGRLKDLDTLIMDFARGVISGKYECDNEEMTMRDYVSFAVRHCSTLSWYNVIRLSSEKDTGAVTEIERAIRITIASNPVDVLVATAAAQTNAVTVFDYNGRYIKEKADIYSRLFTLLRHYGFYVEDEELRSILDGTHKLYRAPENTGTEG